MRRALTMLILLVACSNAGSDLGLTPTATRTVVVRAFIDRDGSGTSTSADTAYTGAKVSLRPAGGGKAVFTATTSALGGVLISPVSVGQYAVTVDSASTGDSLQVGFVDPNPLVLSATPDTGQVGITIRLEYPSASIRQARVSPPGKRLMIRGLILAGVQSFRDTTAYVQDTSGYVRLTRVSLRGGLTGNSPGDSVTIIGSTSSRSGQPTLDLAIITLVGPRPAPVPRFISTRVAATAMGGTLDAALVQVDAAIITDTAAVVPDFRVVADDGSGVLAVLLDAQGGYNRSLFVPGRRMTVRGVLVPLGAGQWQLKPRSPGDITVFQAP